MRKADKKRQVDFQIIAQWGQTGERVLDLGCGRGVLLEYLKRKKSIYGVGVDIDFDKILSCVKRGVPAYQGDVASILATFPDDSFDRVIFSRTVEQLEEPDAIIQEGLRVGRCVTIGFINRGFWVNRVNAFFKGERTVNDVYPKDWYDSTPANPFSVHEFEEFCEARKLMIENYAHLAGDWQSPCKWMPNLMAGYAIYDLSSSM